MGQKLVSIVQDVPSVNEVLGLISKKQSKKGERKKRRKRRNGDVSNTNHSVEERPLALPAFTAIPRQPLLFLFLLKTC